MAGQGAERRRDHGLFGPGSVVWRVFQHPSSFTVGFQRTVVTEMFEPRLLASVVHTGAVERRPSSRYDRTLQYVATVAFGDSEQVLRASEALYAIHARIRGEDAASGLSYDANAPDEQLWIHLTQWHSVLRCYELLGPGPLSVAEDRAYWAACRTAAALQTIDPATVPGDRAEMRAYYERIRPTLTASDDTRRLVGLLLRDGPLAVAARSGRLAGIAALPAVEVLARATVATLPTWMRELVGIRQPAAVGRAALATVRAGLRPMEEPRRALAVARVASPATAGVVGPALLGAPVEHDEVVTPEALFTRVGRPTIRARHVADRAADRTPATRAPRDAGRDGLLPLA